MASTPSASALSAVLRCRGNIWTRNSSTKRPACSAYSLGLAGGALRESPAERTGAQQAFPHGERVVTGRRRTVAHRPDGKGVKQLREGVSGGINKACHRKLSSGDAPGNTLLSQLARRLTSHLPGREKCSEVRHVISHQTSAAHIWRAGCVQELPAGALKLSVISRCRTEPAGQIPALVLTGCSALKTTCRSLSALVARIVFLKLRRCSSSSSEDDAPQHLRDERSLEHEPPQADGGILRSSEDPQDRPD
ncbi:uncharacterized protein [Brachyistius frenatus]|uniref:uncharacterized protein n=1 Tax=Brachyistius frenatus TaxID=100188 RepID=UPI0037E9AF96